MVHGYPVIKKLCGGLQAFMSEHGFESVSDFKGIALPYFTTHRHLVELQKAALDKKKLAKQGLGSDKDWSGEEDDGSDAEVVHVQLGAGGAMEAAVVAGIGIE